ncbi:MAG: hypothetical protein ACE5GW_12525 [Planctomycetota bacterium]
MAVAISCPRRASILLRGARPALLLAVGFLSAMTGCRGPLPQTSRILLRAPDKDVLDFRVELSSPLGVEEYLRFAEGEVAKAGGELRNPDYPDAPVYEVRYTFHSGADHLATVLFRRAEPAAGTGEGILEHRRTLVLKAQGMGKGGLR